MLIIMDNIILWADGADSKPISAFSDVRQVTVRIDDEDRRTVRGVHVERTGPVVAAGANISEARTATEPGSGQENGFA